MKEISITMALVDFVPVILFAVAAIILQQDLFFRYHSTLRTMTDERAS